MLQLKWIKTACQIVFACVIVAPATLPAQSVCLPAPRLLTTMPMGGQRGTELEVVITGETIDDANELVFSSEHISAVPKMDADGKPEPNKYIVTITADCPLGIHEARVMTRLGLSSSRIFSVNDVVEVVQPKPSVSLDTALPLPINSICNGVIPVRAVNHYSFQAKQGQRILVDCAARGIDSKLNAVLILGDADGNDLRVERRGGVIDFTIPSDGDYTIKVHDLTFSGGTTCFYRLALRELSADAPIERLAATQSVSAHSWPPADLAANSSQSESEPNDDQTAAQHITLPCDIAGSFFPAADVDRYEFEAKAGETWWVEVASQRLGCPTDPAAIVQQVTREGDTETLVDIAELSDIPSPVKVSTNRYSYDGPPYDAGSVDILGKIDIKTDGVYRLQLSDLFGGTRNDPQNIYRLIIRKAKPDFAVVAWGLHMLLRNGDRNALAKPMAIRGGATMALEAVVIRRDAFDGEIEMEMRGLPDGVTATGLKFGKGQSRANMLITADEGAPRGFASAKLIATATINGKVVERPCSMASMAWSTRNARDEIPTPRLMLDTPVSVGGDEVAPLSIAAKENKVWEATEGETLTIPLIHMRRCDFSGANLSARTFGAGFESNPKFDLPLQKDASDLVLNLAKLKTKPGDYTIAIYGGAVAKYTAAGQSKPKDIVDVVVSEPIKIRVNSAPAKVASTKPAEQK